MTLVFAIVCRSRRALFECIYVLAKEHDIGTQEEEEERRGEEREGDGENYCISIGEIVACRKCRNRDSLTVGFRFRPLLEIHIVEMVMIGETCRMWGKKIGGGEKSDDL